MRVVDLGLISFHDALALQETAVEDVLVGGEERLFVLEHHPVITFGRHGGEAFLSRSPEELRARGIEVTKASRGGSVTCHFPGQAVLYPIMRLSGRPGGLRKFFHDLEQTGIEALACLGIDAGRSEGRPGVWVATRGERGGPRQKSRKIASVGVGVRHWVSYHGLALNAEPDLSLFSMITACGLPGVEMTSAALELTRMGHSPEGADVRRVKDALVKAFLRIAAR
jgi:lipoyl(octanoyl) transferase